MAKGKGSLKRTYVRKAMLRQLEETGRDTKYFTDMVEDYMSLWDMKEGLIADVKERGEKVHKITAAADNIITNESVLDSLKVSAQMLKIADHLDIKPVLKDGGLDEPM